MTPLLRKRILAFAALAECGVGLLLMLDPSTVARLLLGEPTAGLATVLGRCFGVALVALGIACWPPASATSPSGPPLRGIAVYNVLVALYLAYLGAGSHAAGMLLWPTVVLHAGVALLLLWPERR